jgi:hypothetical protein
MLTGVGGRADTAHARRHARHRRAAGGRWLAWALVLAAACAVLFALYLRQSLISAVTSDGAANVLQAQALDHRHLLLRGWWTSDVSFYPTELAEYAFVTAVRGLSPDVVHICGALTYTLTVVLAALLARGRTSGRAPDLAAGWHRVAIAAGIMLAPSILGGTQVFLENPDHAGTAVPVLALLLLLDRAAAGRWYVAIAACGLLALSQLADPLSLAAATVPLAAVCGLRLVVAAVRRRPRAAFRDDGLLLTAAAVSAGLARLATHAIRSLGGFDVPPLRDTLLVPLATVPANASTLYRSLVLLFGANNPGVPHRPIMIARHVPLVLMADLHIIGPVLAGAGFAAGIAAFVSGRADRVTQVLAAAIGVMLTAGVFTQLMRSLANAHEVAIVVPLGAALAGRTLPPLARRLASARVWPARLAAAALALWLVVGVAELCYAAGWWPDAPPPMQAVTAWLVGHHEREGLAGYWQADVTTVASAGRVLVAPVPGNAARPDHWESSAGWYQPA